VEESEEAEALADSLNAREDDFTVGAVRAEIKNVPKDSTEYDLLKKVEGLLTDRTALNRSIKEEEKALNDAAEEKIEQLSNDEIDMIMHDKWFGNLIEKMEVLVEQPLKNELDDLK